MRILYLVMFLIRFLARSTLFPYTTLFRSLGMALVLGSPESQGSGIRLTWDICEPMRTTTPRPGEASALAGNAMAAGLPLFEALAADTASLVTLDLSRGLSLRGRVSP